MKIEFEERTWEFDPDAMDVRQASVLHLTYGLTIKAWSDGFPELDYRSYHFAYWLMLQQAGIVRPIADCNPKIVEFIAAYQEAYRAESDEEAEAGPTSEPPSGPQGEPTASKAPASRTTGTRRHRDQPEEEPTGS